MTYLIILRHQLNAYLSQTMQNCLGKLSQRLTVFNCKKCSSNCCPMVIFLQLTFNIKYHYHLNNTALESTELVKGLGVKISKELTYHQHIKEINIVCC